MASKFDHTVNRGWIKGGPCRGRARALRGAAGSRHGGLPRHRGVCQSLPMRPPNYYAAPGFERAGLRRREPDWIRARVLDPESVFVPVWRTHNLVIEVEGGEPRAAVLNVEAVGSVLGGLTDGDVEEHFVRGELVFLGLLDIAVGQTAKD